jgi:hypothetical protein
MVAQHGTLNFVDNYVYIVLSLPISAFTNIDDDKDGNISLNEFNKHRHDVSEEIIKSIYLSVHDADITINGLLLNPSFDHEHVKGQTQVQQNVKHLDQVTITGRYTLPSAQSKVNFNIKLFSIYKTLQRYEITAIDKKQQVEYQFDLTPSLPFSKVFN